MRLQAFTTITMLGFAACTASAEGIFVVDQPDVSGSACVDLEASMPYEFSLYVIADTGSLPLGGVASAEFSLQGLQDLFGVPPDGMLVWNAEPNPASIALGDPLAGGTNIAFGTCQSGAVLLFTLHMIAYDHTGLRELHVASRQPPSNPSFDCPLVTLCDAPLFTARCVPGGVTYFDVPAVAPPPTDPFPADGATAVPLQVTLRWNIPQIRAEVCEAGLIWQDIYFGTTPEPPYVNSSSDKREYAPPTLAPNTTYYWRVQAGPDPTPVWRFTTGDAIAARGLTWTDVRTLYR